MKKHLVPKQQRFDLPKMSTPDSIAELVRAVLSQKAVVQRIVLTAEPAQVQVSMMVPSREPPHGEVDEGEPRNLWQAFQSVELKEVKDESKRFNRKSLAIITTMLAEAADKKLAGVCFATGSIEEFAKWVGYPHKEGELPTMFWNIPLIESGVFPSDKLVLLCAKSVRAGPLRSEVGFMVQMYKEARDVGQGK